MTDGSLKLNETDRTSRSYTEITSTFPWHQSVIAFCQWTTLSGSYVALSRSVCSISLSHSDRSAADCQYGDGRKMIVYSGLGRQRPPDLSVRRVLADTSDIHMLRNGIRFLVILVCANAARCASSSAVPLPFPSPSHHAPAPLPD